MCVMFFSISSKSPILILPNNTPANISSYGGYGYADFCSGGTHIVMSECFIRVIKILEQNVIVIHNPLSSLHTTYCSKTYAYHVWENFGVDW